MEAWRISQVVCPILAVAVVALCPGKGVAIDSPIGFDVDMSGTLPQLVNIRCSLDPNLTTMATVEELAIYGPNPNSKKNDFQALASVDRWNLTPRLFSNLGGAAAVDLTGGFRFETNRSELSLSWTSPDDISGHRYKCAAQGTDLDGELVTISEVVRLVTKDAPQVCCDSNGDAILEKVSDLEQSSFGMRASLQYLENSIEGVQNSLNVSSSERDRKNSEALKTVVVNLTQNIDERLNEHFATREQNLTSLHSFLHGVQHSMAVLQQTLADQASVVRRLEARAVFDVSGEFNGKRYLVSKSEEAFNIRAADRSCGQFGGYLVEIDDRAEYDFLVQFLRSVGGTHSFATGINDIEKERRYVYYHSKEPFKLNIWDSGEPNNQNNEDCTGIRTYKKGLNDIPCDSKVKYVCEASL